MFNLKNKVAKLFEYEASSAVSKQDLIVLSETIRRYKDTIENSAEGIIQTTLEGKFLQVNKAFASMLGYESPEELLTVVTEIGSQLYVSESDRNKFRSDVIQNGKARSEYQAWKKDGTTAWLLASSRSVYSLDGEFLYFESIVEDITERIIREQQLEKLTESLRCSNTELKRFANVVAHDISSPLNSVQSFCELLAEITNNKLDDECREYLTNIQESIFRMRTVIRDILSISEIEANALVTEECNLNLLLKDVLKDLTAAIRAIDAEVSCGPLPVLKVDKTKISRLLQNLISNALKFRREVPLKISVSAFEHDGEWTFAVRDNGLGFDENNKEIVFEMFSRLTSPRYHEGSGMGLALCKRIVLAHGGRIWAESKPGLGSTFYFTLPLTPI